MLLRKENILIRPVTLYAEIGGRNDFLWMTCQNMPFKHYFL